jgi:hypothetical protein
LKNPDQEFSICILDKFSPKCPWTHFVDAASDAMTKGINFAGNGSICEGCSLVIMLVSFAVAGALCIRRFYAGTTIRATAVGRRNSKVRLQILVTVSYVFATFLLRCLYSVVLALSRTTVVFLSQFDGAGSRCSANSTHTGMGLCDPCQMLGVTVQAWLWLCPAFSFTVFLLSSPVTILIALWGMTTDNLLQSLEFKWRYCFRRKSTQGDGLKSFIGTGGDM